MSKQHELPPAMVEAATDAVRRRRRCSEESESFAMAALEAAGVPALRARIAELEAESDRLAKANAGSWSLYQECASANEGLAVEIGQLAARIAELEAALRNRICEGCNALVANVGMLHLCGCDEQRNLCSACKAGCACAGGRE